MKKVLFIPAQAGLAHILRSQAVAHELTSSGVDCHILMEKTKVAKVPKVPKSTIHLFQAPELTEVEIMNKFIKKSISKQEIQKIVSMYRKHINEIKPDLVVIDTETLAMMTCYLYDIKFVLIANALLLPLRRGVAGEDAHNNPVVQTFKNISGLITNKYILGLLNDLVKKIGYYPVKSPDEFLKNVPVILPEWKEYVHLIKYLPSMYFVGPILNPYIEKRNGAFEEQIKADAKSKKIVYVSFGGTGYSAKKLQEIVTALASKGLFVVVSTGTIANPKDFKLNASDGYVSTFVPGLSATKLADCVVSHSSQGTIVHCILNNTPIVCIPFNLDQLVHAHKVTEFGIGLNAHKLKRTDYLRNMYSWEWLQSSAESIPIETVTSAVEEVIVNELYKENLEKIRQRFGTGEDGAKKAAKIVEIELDRV